MRLHGIHVRGLRCFPGEHRIALEPGCNLLPARHIDEARTLAAVVDALLHPKQALDEVMERMRVGAEDVCDDPARAVLVLSGRGEALRLAVDLTTGDVRVARYSSRDRLWHEQEGGASSAELGLARLGRGPGSDFACLHTLGIPGDPAPHSDPQPVSAVVPSSVDPTAAVDAAEIEARRTELAAARERVEICERGVAALVGELERFRPLRDISDLEPRIDRFRRLVERREADRTALVEQRSAWLLEREQLRSAPGRQVVPLGLGLALAISGGSVAALGYGLGYLPAALGGVAAVVALGLAQSAKSRLRQLEAELARLRVRESAIEREYESEGAQVRGVLLALGLDSADDLEAAAAEYRRLLKRLEEADAELEAARETFSPEAAAELDRLESLETLPPTAPPEPPAPTDASSVGRETALSPDRLIEAIRLTDEEVHGLLAPRLPMYLRALTAGAFAGARRRQMEGWVFRAAQGDELHPWSELSDSLRAAVSLAFQLALLEGLAQSERQLLVVGPDLPLLSGESTSALARAFRRLGGVAQIVHVTHDASPFREHAGRVIELGCTG